MITPKNLVFHELIGLRCRIVQSRHPANVGKEGRVVDETRQTLALEIAGKEKSFAKQEHVFAFTLQSGDKVRVEGSLLVARPEDRLKKKLRKW